MDFLDPRKIRAHKIRLIVGYFLMSIVILLSTLILVYAAYGYGISTKTGQIIENGLLFTDSKPGGANIYLNNQILGNKTPARLVLAAGNYTLTMKKSGYRTWARSFELDEHTISRYVYPLLFPTKPQITPIKSYSTMPGVVTESPDRHWLLVQSESSLTSLSFEQFDASNLAQPPTAIDVPRTLLTVSAEPSSFKVVEWSTDNNHLLLTHNFGANQEFIVVNRSNPDQSFNVNKLFKINPTEVALRNKKIDQLYLYDQSTGSLQVGDTGQGQLDPAFLKNVLAFKAYGSSIVTFVTDVGAPSGKVIANIWDNGKIYPLYSFDPGSKYLLDTAEFQNHIYYIAGSNTTDRLRVFKDPEDSIRNPSYRKALPLLALTQSGATDVHFSENTRFISVEAGQNFSVYDFETQHGYRYTVKAPLSAPLAWMDGHRLIGQSGSDVFIMDYDNINQILLSPTLFQSGGVFSNDYNQMVTFAPGADSTTVVMERVDLRAGTDLPANGKQ